VKKLNIKLRQLVLFAIVGLAAFGGVSSYLSRGHVEFQSAMAYTSGQKNTKKSDKYVDSENASPENLEINAVSNDAEMNHSREAIINGKVNLNAASLEQLQIAPGIGPAKAQKIIDYREEYGGFSCVEELTEISGIGEKTLAKIKDYYCAE